MPEQNDVVNGYGLKLTGLIMDKGTWKNPTTGEINHQLHVAVPGQRGTMQVSCSAAAWDRSQVMKPFSNNIAMGSSRDGRTFFTMVE